MKNSRNICVVYRGIRQKISVCQDCCAIEVHALYNGIIITLFFHVFTVGVQEAPFI